MDSTNKNEILTNFIAVTQCSQEEATRYLEAAQWNPQTAMEIFFDDGSSHAGGTFTAENIPNTGMNVNQGSSSTSATGGYDSDDENAMQTAIDESIRSSAGAAKPTESKGGKGSSTSSRFGTIGALQHEQQEEQGSDEEGQAFYAGGSERSGQQILGPPKSKDFHKKVEKLFEAARKQGATEADDDENSSSAQKKKEKAFSGVGYTLGDDTTPSRPTGQILPEATAANVPNRVEQIPLRFFSNGFTVGDGELRKFEENQEFMAYIKRGEVPPELRNLTAGGRQVEVRLEDHRNEEYRAVAPQFKPFGGTGHMLGSPVPTVTGSKSAHDNPFQSSAITTSSAIPTVSDLSALEKLAEQQLKSSSSSTVIRLRLPDISTPVRIVIDLNRTLTDLRKFLNQNVPSLQSNQFQFLEPPASRIKHEDENKTIGEAKLSNATLAIRRGS